MIDRVQDKRLKDVFRITLLAIRLQRVKRVLFAPHEDRAEGDAEHSYQLALLAWFLVKKMRLRYSLERVICYSLVHDLPEVHAGDTDVYHNGSLGDKHEREARACELLKSEFPDFPEMHKLILEYESGQTEEACFVKALDKLVAAVGIAIDDGRSWHVRQTTFWKMVETQRPKVACHQGVLKMYDKLLAFLEKNKSHFFPRSTNNTFPFANGDHLPFVVRPRER